MFTTLPNHSGDSSVNELRQYGSKASQWQGRHSFSHLQAAKTFSATEWYTTDLDVSASNVSPLMPLRQRDLAVLTDLFEDSEMVAIEADVLQNLRQLLPAPCWEDDPLDFLQDYL